MSSLSQAASSVEKRTNARYWIVVMLFIVILQLHGDRATLTIAGSEMAKDISLDPVGMGYVSAAFSGRMLSGRSRWLVAGSFWFKTRLLLVDLYLVDVYLAAKASSISLVDSALSFALFTLRFSVGLRSPSFPGIAALLRRFPAQERGTAVSILTPPNTSHSGYLRRLWAG